MEKLFNDFGFDTTFFVAQIINFLILAYIFKRFLYKPILKVLHDREKKIAQGVADSEKAALELTEAENTKDEIIKRATLEAEKIIDETKKQTEKMRNELFEKARIDAQKIIDEARNSASEEKKIAERQAKDTSIEIAKKVLTRILDELFTKQEKEKIITRDIKKLTDYEY